MHRFTHRGIDDDRAARLVGAVDRRGAEGGHRRGGHVAVGDRAIGQRIRGRSITRRVLDEAGRHVQFVRRARRAEARRAFQRRLGIRRQRDGQRVGVGHQRRGDIALREGLVRRGAAVAVDVPDDLRPVKIALDVRAVGHPQRVQVRPRHRQYARAVVVHRTGQGRRRWRAVGLQAAVGQRIGRRRIPSRILDEAGGHVQLVGTSSRTEAGHAFQRRLGARGQGNCHCRGIGYYCRSNVVGYKSLVRRGRVVAVDVPGELRPVELGLDVCSVGDAQIVEVRPGYRQDSRAVVVNATAQGRSRYYRIDADQPGACAADVAGGIGLGGGEGFRALTHGGDVVANQGVAPGGAGHRGGAGVAADGEGHRGARFVGTGNGAAGLAGIDHAVGRDGVESWR